MRFTNPHTQSHTHTHTFNGPFSGTTQVSWYQKGKTNLDFTEARDSEWQWHQLGHMQVCILLQTDNHTSTPPLCFFYRPDALPAAQPTASKHWRQPTQTVNQLKVVGQLLNDLIDMSPVGDDRPESVDLEVMRIQNGGDTSPVPSLALTDTDFGGGRGEPDTGRSTLLRSAHQCIPLLSEFRVWWFRLTEKLLQQVWKHITWLSTFYNSYFVSLLCRLFMHAVCSF